MIKIGLLGGSFNPIHSGHITIAEQAFEQLSLDKVLFIPTGNHPLKNNENMLSLEARKELILLAIQAYPKFELSLLDASSKEKSYTYNLIHKLKEQYQDDQFYFIGGSDIIYELPKWYKFDWLLDNLNFCIFPRPDYSVNCELVPVSLDKITLLDMKPVNISSTLIRDNIRNSISIKNLVPEIIRNKVLVYYKN